MRERIVFKLLPRALRGRRQGRERFGRCDFGVACECENNQAKRRDAYCKLGKLIQEDAVQNYIYLFQDGYGFSTKLTRYVVSTWGSMTWDVQNWKYK